MDISLTIDSIGITAPAGATVFQAARMSGIDIPHLCYEPDLGLPPTAACRLCVVEVEGAPNPVASCAHPVSNGMVVRTDTPELREIRRMVIELLLSDHPHDCAGCAESGECALERYAYALGVREPGASVESQVAKPAEDAPMIVYDRSSAFFAGAAWRFARECRRPGRWISAGEASMLRSLCRPRRLEKLRLRVVR